MNQNQIVSETSDDICLEPSMKNFKSSNCENTSNPNIPLVNFQLNSTDNYDRESIMDSETPSFAARMNGLTKRTNITDDIPIRRFDPLRTTDQLYDPTSLSPPLEGMWNF